MKRVQKASLEIVTKMCTQFRRLKINFWALDLGLKSFLSWMYSLMNMTILKGLIGTELEHYKYHPSAKFQEVSN